MLKPGLMLKRKNVSGVLDCRGYSHRTLHFKPQRATTSHIKNQQSHHQPQPFNLLTFSPDTAILLNPANCVTETSSHPLLLVNKLLKLERQSPSIPSTINHTETAPVRAREPLPSHATLNSHCRVSFLPGFTIGNPSICIRDPNLADTSPWMSF
ncbi:hypothetical protein CC79DRAFT_190081 [Sarocladium strictum]